ncbi:phosphatase PAP2 family protein [Mesobacterium pallidum]|uniref:phosphatase PAP2 family protein n=1 Tax=Mesobacterium pallidum TaxID=2872037 RepID=UPI001EE26A4E|nr:phosphatase PAP2 family protein [Mesobacterium pallidum]
MRLFVTFVLGYVAAASFFIWVHDADPVARLSAVVASLPGQLGFFLSNGWTFLLPFVALIAVAPDRGALVRRIPAAGITLVAVGVFTLCFTMVKATLPQAMPFWADPLMADIDRALHLGHDPWALTHALPFAIPPEAAHKIYLSLWLLPSMWLPVFVVLLDRDVARQRRFITLYVLSWVILGNILAWGFMSAGPVYYDRLLGGDTFAGLTAALQSAGITEGRVGYYHDHLWQLYTSGAQDAGSGISAFPSVHVAMATVIALYLFELRRNIWPLSLAIVLLYQFLSVYLGWHYAVDGYASIAAVVALWLVLRRSARLAEAAVPV